MTTKELPKEILKVVETLLQPYHINLTQLLDDNGGERIRKKFLSVKEASEIYSVSRHTLFRWAKAGKIKTVKCSPGKSGKVLLNVASIEKFMQDHSA